MTAVRIELTKIIYYAVLMNRVLTTQTRIRHVNGSKLLRTFHIVERCRRMLLVAGLRITGFNLATVTKAKPLTP